MFTRLRKLVLLSFCRLSNLEFDSLACFKRRTSHAPNLMLMNKFHCFTLFALDSAHVKFDVWNRPLIRLGNWFNYLLLLKHIQGRSQVSKQDEASLDRRRCEPLGGSGGMPPRKFWNLEVQNCSFKRFSWHFSSEKSIFVKVRISIFFCWAILVPQCCIIKINWIHESSQRLWLLYYR